jgi:hypothetical protein
MGKQQLSNAQQALRAVIKLGKANARNAALLTAGQGIDKPPELARFTAPACVEFMKNYEKYVGDWERCGQGAPIIGIFSCMTSEVQYQALKLRKEIEAKEGDIQDESESESESESEDEEEQDADEEEMESESGQAVLLTKAISVSEPRNVKRENARWSRVLTIVAGEETKVKMMSNKELMRLMKKALTRAKDSNKDAESHSDIINEQQRILRMDLGPLYEVGLNGGQRVVVRAVHKEMAEEGLPRLVASRMAKLEKPDLPKSIEAFFDHVRREFTDICGVVPELGKRHLDSWFGVGAKRKQSDREQEDQREGADAEDADQEVAPYWRVKTNHQGGDRKLKKKLCSKCSARHVPSDTCPAAKSDDEEKKGENPNPTEPAQSGGQPWKEERACHKCKKVGHLIRHCPEK